MTCGSYDPHLLHLFFGEEISMAARLYTHGVDCYTPPEVVCYHLWSRSLRPVHVPSTLGKVNQAVDDPTNIKTTTATSSTATSTSTAVSNMSQEESMLKQRSLNRVRRLLHITPSTTSSLSANDTGSDLDLETGSEYGLGKVRSLSSFESALGVSFDPLDEGIDYAQPANRSSGPSRISGPPHKPRLVHKESKWGGQSSDLFDETRTQSLLAALGVVALN
jgi:hypothetical protein